MVFVLKLNPKPRQVNGQTDQRDYEEFHLKYITLYAKENNKIDVVWIV